MGAHAHVRLSDTTHAALTGHVAIAMRGDAAFTDRQGRRSL